MNRTLLIILSILLLASCKTTPVEAPPEVPFESLPDAVSQVFAVGDSVQVKEGGAQVYQNLGGAPVDFAPAGTKGVILKTKNKGGTVWSRVDFEVSFAGDKVQDDRLEPVSGDPGDPIPPTAAFTWLTDGLEVAFISTSADPDGSIVSYSWTFGDGSTSTAQNPSNTYSSSGSYSVSLTVTDNDGLTDTTTETVTVDTNPGGSGNFDRVVIIGCSNTDNWLRHNTGNSQVTLNPAGGQSGKTIVLYGEQTVNKNHYQKFRDNVASAGADLDLVIYMICQRYGPGRQAARQADVPYSLPAPDSGSDLYSEKDLVKNILGEMSYHLQQEGRADVAVSVVPMHRYIPDGANTNPCERIGSNGIFAQEDYVDEINAEGTQSSLLRPSHSFTPLPLTVNGGPWRMPPVSQNGDVNPNDKCHLTGDYVDNTLMPSFVNMLNQL